MAQPLPGCARDRHWRGRPKSQARQPLEVVRAREDAPPSVALWAEPAPRTRWRLDAVSALEVVAVIFSDRPRPRNPADTREKARRQRQRALWEAHEGG
jgi:hypothetical protein